MKLQTQRMIKNRIIKTKEINRFFVAFFVLENACCLCCCNEETGGKYLCCE